MAERPVVLSRNVSVLVGALLLLGLYLTSHYSYLLTVRFWVRDNGPGLTAEDQEVVFTSFTRLDQIRVTGHGLGLSIVRRIVEKLDGQVGVESECGKGSLFFFTLPGVD